MFPPSSFLGVVNVDTSRAQPVSPAAHLRGEQDKWILQEVVVTYQGCTALIREPPMYIHGYIRADTSREPVGEYGISTLSTFPPFCALERRFEQIL